MSQQYSPLLDTGHLPSNDLPRRRSSLSESDSDSDVSYRDQLDTEPFNEKGDSRFQDEPTLEDEIGVDGQPRRVSLWTLPSDESSSSRDSH
jgi:hypothetical protein